MPQNVHVPKFGNWDSENIPYTSCFENARKDKGAGSAAFNPNDPEDNPDAFMPMTLTRENDCRKQHHSDKSSDIGTVNGVCASSDIAIHSVKHHQKKNYSREDGGFRGYMESPAHHLSSGQRGLEPQRSRNRRSNNSESGSDKYNFDSHHRYRSSKSSIDGSYVFSPSPAIVRTGNSGHLEAQHRRVPSVPKFGDWDETDPKSAEGFTVIFDKVKEEKKIAGANMPAVLGEPMIYQVQHRSNAFSRSKITCCLFPSINE